ncbi:transporter associated domain-containing protein [Polyangium sp. y55x31]|uniref:transporter associated domain-containing protein n=1 Tax=Polyangium sp. y55x31 TaxID=3042688 RepID=UPI002482BAB8|nr:transporter associated domain-containing protein [Polyangium sp. y55x31]MDI1476379.1 transporter associated domain-containing protein [Polyangium sp. y55x31]
MWNRELGLDLPVGDAYSTLAGLVLDLARSIPAVGTQLTAPDGTTIEVVEATPRHVKRVRIKLPVSPNDER